MFDTRGKKERSLGVNLMLKPHRSMSPKAVMVRRPYPPGLHGKKRRTRLSEFALQLKEKQKIRVSYGLRETALRQVMKEAFKHPGVTGEIMMSLLEQRLDNALFRLGIAPSRSMARQLVSHGHFVVNNRKVTIPSYRLRVGDVVSIRPQSSAHPQFKELKETLKKIVPPAWLSLDPEKLQGTMKSLPKDFDIPFDVNLVVDYYSKIVK